MRRIKASRSVQNAAPFAEAETRRRAIGVCATRILLIAWEPDSVSAGAGECRTEESIEPEDTESVSFDSSSTKHPYVNAS
jgi:hypothetical protein